MHLRAAATRVMLSSTCLMSFALLPAHAQDATPAQTTTVRIGAKSIVLPAPSADPVETGPDYRVLLDPLTPATNRLAAAFVPPADVADLHSGSVKPMTNYALVEVLRQAEFADIDPEMFKQITDSVGQQFGDGSLDATLKDEEAELNHTLKKLNSQSSTVNFDKPLLLGSLFAKPNASGFGMIMPISSNGTTVKMVVGLMVIRTQNRAIFAYLYSTYKDESSVLYIRKTTELWADAILKANAQ